MGITNLPFKKYNKSSHVFFDYELPEDLFIEQWTVAKGTIVKLSTTQNFGFLCIPQGCKDKRGFEIPNRIFKYREV